MKLIITILTIATISLGMSAFKLQHSNWLNFKKTYGKSYPSVEEEQIRLSIYESNLRTIAEHNAKYAAREVTYFLKENQFADMTSYEVQEMISRTKPDWSRNFNRSNVHQQYRMRNSLVAESKDWREYGAVTPVKNQAAYFYNCVSSWAFSALGALESHQFLSSGKLASLSVQNLVDCSDPEGNHGCNGGVTDYAYDYIIENGGIDTEESYPFVAHQEDCRYDSKNSGAKMTSYMTLPSGSEQAVLETISNIGPVTAAIDFSPMSFLFYAGGVFNEPKCKSGFSDLNQGVVIVGYGSDPEGDYWLVKNSLGVNWGMDGYIKMTRNGSNQCGIATHNLYPIVGKVMILCNY